ncbi:MAG: hypothetical protein HON76_02555 [Candidatus Scalindua sp.]|jgi:hypothetical protein|nr:hypothetical protein [Candidatus Scalindua sp.]MBT5306516.1 hypothetical protein [Candidatus Scalindua sp.]MBT6046936.1 hypothetical protein [Candidatus Scalindua sp.]MBT6227577.1 hypothetical protein [Candidatus Scalindua sp.]MBT6561392.1 hypothetical protein [Candidatus Scalindua sp.]
MRAVQKEKIYGYAFIAVLSLILLFCLYNVVCILFLSPSTSRKIQSRVSNAVNAVESVIKHAGPKKTENIIYKPNLENKTNGSSRAHQIERSILFAGPTKIRAEEAKIEETEEEIVLYEEVEATGSTEIIFKGKVHGLAYIKVIKKIEGEWYEHGFPTKVGKRIGGKKIIAGEMLDFTTNYVLLDIVSNAQRPTELMKKVLILNEKGEFAGTRMVPGETYMKSSSKVKYRDENGITRELWLGEGQEKELYSKVIDNVKTNDENIVNNIKPTVSKAGAIKDLTKPQQKIENKVIKSFEKSIEPLRAILDEVENGY